MPLGRRSHQKVRTGCVNCKKRRIKCDEQKPSCKKCLQHRIECYFVDVPTGKRMKEQVSHASACPPPPPLSDSVSLVSTKLSPQIAHGQIDVRLMHHFTMYTCLTLTTKPKIRSVWQLQIPELAFTHHFLLQMIFAVSAMHLSKQSPDMEWQYLSYACQQYEESLKNSSVALAAISPSNCHALYAVSTLGFIFELGTAYGRDELLYSSDGSLAPWLVHLRGLRTILGGGWPHFETGPLKLIFRSEPTRARLIEFIQRLDLLMQEIRQTSLPPSQIQIYIAAVEDLTRWSRTVDYGFVGWVCQFSDDYRTLLSRRDPYALIIFGYACVLLKQCEPRNWFDRWPEGLVRNIHRYLNTSLSTWLEWPMREIGVTRVNDVS